MKTPEEIAIEIFTSDDRQTILSNLYIANNAKEIIVRIEAFNNIYDLLQMRMEELINLEIKRSGV